ncbi:hypothetical protein [Schlesneria paludicola]|uniref:hypothetical protein n=1 Tax=Schlesneria paludicola TaxID=360056 RepID=UPI0002E2046C|nr:hypothetical protein [Schlesneria paludicola]
MTPLEDDTTKADCGPVIALIGNRDHAEMRPICDWLSELLQADPQSLTVYSTIVGRLESANDLIPDLIVLLQGWSDEYSRIEILQLLAIAPLARVVVCAGAWCESDGRNRDLWPQAVRVPIWAATERLHHEWQLITGQHDRSPLLWSASKEEVFAFDNTPVPLGVERLTILVDSPDPAYRRFLIDVLGAEGHQLVADSPSLVLFDADPWDSGRVDALNAVRHRWPLAEICVVSDEASPICANELQEFGVTQIRHKLGFHLQRGSSCIW